VYPILKRETSTSHLGWVVIPLQSLTLLFNFEPGAGARGVKLGRCKADTNLRAIWSSRSTLPAMTSNF
jgi:hypothetical protein